MIITLAFFLFHFFLSTSALSWNNKRRGQFDKSSSEVSHDFFMDDSGLTQSETEILFLNKKYGDLEMYSNKPDCFRLAASKLRTRCSELDMDEDTRVNVAIRMTLCELATARHYSPPLECTIFSQSEPSTLPDPPVGSQGSCVEALSRSAQFWSSYSGYLREVPQLCYAFRRWNDIDTARDIYKNATIEKLALIRFILQREETVSNHLHASEVNLEGVRRLTDQMHHLNEIVSLTSNELKLQLETGFHNNFELFKNAVMANQKQKEVDHSIYLAQVDTAIEQIIDRHTVALAAFLPTLSSSLASNLDDLYTIIHRESVTVINLLNDVDDKWSSLSAGIFNLHHSISHLTQTTTEAAFSLSSHLSAAQAAHVLQNETNSAVSELVDTITRLKDDVHAEIEWMNKTGSQSRATFLKWEKERDRVGHFLERCGWYMITWIGEVVWRVDASSLEQIAHLPIFRLALLFARILRYVAQSAFSSFMSVLVVLVSSKRYFRKTATIPTHNLIACPVLPSPLVHQVPYPYYYQFAKRQSSLYHYYPTSANGRFSRIPNRLCKPTTSPC